MKPNGKGWARCLPVVLAFVVGAPPAAAAEADVFPPPNVIRPTVVRIAPPSGSVGFGTSVAGLGDVDGDGFGDVVVGAPGSDHAYVISGATAAILHDIAGPIPGLEFGAAVAAVGDVDHDGVADLAVGAPPEPDTLVRPCPAGPVCDQRRATGEAFVFSGATAGLVRRWAPTIENLAFGRSVAGGGDLSGDGVPDVVVGAPGLEQGTDTVFAYSGADGTQLWSRGEPSAPAGSRARFGESVSVTPDESGDKVVDLLVPAPAAFAAPAVIPVPIPFSAGLAPAPAKAGRVYVLSGADGGVVRSFADPAPTDGDAFGAAAAAIGDQDGDGVSDHFIGERATDQLHLYSGRDRTLIRSIAIPSPTPGQAAFALARVDDTNGDGRDDVWVGSGAARAALLLSGTGAVLAHAAAPSVLGSFGQAVSAMANPRGDPGADLVVGDPTEPGGGAAYLVSTGSTGLPPVADTSGRWAATCPGAACKVPSRLQAGTSPTRATPTAEPQTTTTAALATTTSSVPTAAVLPALPGKVVSSTATLPRPASATPVRDPLPKTGGVDGSLAGLWAVAVGLVVTALARDRDSAHNRESGRGRRRDRAEGLASPARSSPRHE